MEDLYSKLRLVISALCEKQLEAGACAPFNSPPQRSQLAKWNENIDKAHASTLFIGKS